MNNEPYNQPSASPTPKVAMAGIAGAISIVLIWLAKEFFSVDIPAEVAAAITTIMAFLGGYFKQDEKPVEAIPLIKGEL